MEVLETGNESERIPSSPTPPPWLCLSAERACEAPKRPSLSLQAGELTFVVVTEFLTFNRGGKIMMFPLHGGAIGLQSVCICVFTCLSILEGMNACMTYIKAGIQAREGRA